MVRIFSIERLIALAVLALLLAVRVVDPFPVQNLRNSVFDAFQQSKPRIAAPTPVTILDIDDASLQALGQWPWPRSLLANLVERVFAEGAIALAFDIIFAEPDRLSLPAIARDNPSLPTEARDVFLASPSNDEIFADAIARARVILGQTSSRFTNSGVLQSGETQTVPHAILGEDARHFLWTFPDLVENLPILEAAAAGRGVFSVRPDPDGIYRRIPVAMMVDDNLRLGLGPELLRVATGGQAFALRGNAAGADGVVVGGQLVETAANGTIQPYLSPSAPQRFVSAVDVLDGTMPEGRLQGQLVLVGTSAIGLEDLRPTALGVSMPGVEIHAQALENILTGTLLVRPNYAIAVELAILATLGVLAIALVPILGARLILLFSLVLIGGYCAATWFVFQNQLVLLDPSWPTAGTFLTTLVMSSANYLREEQERRQIRSAFGQYVSPDLVERLSRDPQALKLGGEHRDLTILFSDVRGFTTLAEAYRDDPAGLTSLMNTFLTVLSNEIIQERGTIDKFMGDAVMAFWNAPLDIEDHEAAGCRAALAMQAAVGGLNAQRTEEAARTGAKLPLIDVGIGLNTGDCIVGNMGSDARFDYTALGDAVNLASRLEGQSKTYGVNIILGQNVAEAVKGRFAMLDLDLLRVKGKQEPERIFGLLGPQAMLDDPLFVQLNAANETMRATYSRQQWNDAISALADIDNAAAQAGLDLNGYTAMYRARIDDLENADLPTDWDGVHIAATK